VEHDTGNLPAVQSPVGVTHILAEPAHNCGKSRSARSDGVAREQVGVNGRDAEALETCAHVAFAGGDATRERHARYTSFTHVIRHNSLRLCLDVVEDRSPWIWD
jgi:hypothetical protein